MRFAIPFALLPLFFFEQCSCSGQDIRGYYKPPLIPVSVSVNSSGRVSLSASSEIITPIGTFGIGAGVSTATSKTNTYFIVRNKGQETVYCVGTRGKIRLNTEGSHRVEISTARDRANVFIVDVSSASGTVVVDFVPDPDEQELARIRFDSSEHLVLKRDGALLVDTVNDWGYPNFDHAVFARINETSSMYVSIVSRTGRPHNRRISGDKVYEALWFKTCLQSVNKNLVRETSAAGRYGRFKNLVVFDDGSIAFSDRLDDFIPSSVIKDLSVVNNTTFKITLNRQWEVEAAGEAPLSFTGPPQFGGASGLPTTQKVSELSANVIWSDVRDFIAAAKSKLK